MKNVFVIGHRNPDSDSVCSSIAFAYLKTAVGLNSVPRVLSPINRESEFILKYFNVPIPSYLNDVKVRVKDMDYLKRAYIYENDSINDAIIYMKNHDLTAIPLVNEKNILCGYVSLKDIAKYLISNKRDDLKTNLDLLVNTLDAKVITRFKDDFVGKIGAVTFSSSTFIKEVPLSEESILIVGDRYKVLEHAIKSKVQLIILTRGRELSKKLLSKAIKNEITIISSPYSSFELCNKITLANYISFINSNKNPYTVNLDDYYSDFINVTKKYNYTNYPIVKNNKECVGVVRLTDTANYEKKKVILVDHNNYEQSVEGLHEADIIEVLDHHNIGSIGTSAPISFTCMPVGCTATIIYEQYKKERVPIPRSMAGLLLSAIISDTLLFNSPTTTEMDKKSANELAKIAKVDINKYGIELLKAGSSIKGLSVNELINSDFKSYTVNEKTFGIGIITTMDFDEILKIKSDIVSKLNDMSELSYSFVFIFVTDIIKQGSYIFYNDKAEDVVKNAFNLNEVHQGIFIKNLLSRKKQMIPNIMKELE